MFFTYGYLFYIPVTIVFVILLTINGLINKRPLIYYGIALLSIIYINKAIELTLFPIVIEDIPDFDILYNINLNIYIDKSLYNIIGNIVLTFPIGFGLQYIFNLKLKGRLILAILFSMCFELTQLIILLTAKPINLIFDINDVIYNVAGAILGVLISILINKLIALIPIKTERNDLFTYIYKVCLNCSQNVSSLHNIHYIPKNK